MDTRLLQQRNVEPGAGVPVLRLLLVVDFEEGSCCYWVARGLNALQSLARVGFT